jgi:hypothetical protein
MKLRKMILPAIVGLSLPLGQLPAPVSAHLQSET